MIEFDPSQFQHIKLGLHVAQSVFIFVSWCITIAVFRSSASIDGRAGWYFGLCFLTIPAIIYETMTPRFPNTRKYANPYALATVDGLYTILWLSAFAALANWNSTGKCGNGCKLSEAVVGLGVFIWLFFIGTTFMSLYAVFYYKREGYLPGASRAPMNAQMIDPDKEAFSTAPHDEYARVHNTDDHEIPDYPMGTNTGLGQQTYDAPNYGVGEPTGYGGAAAPSYGGAYAPPRVEDDTGYSGYGGQQDSGRVQFPTARYDNLQG